MFKGDKIKLYEDDSMLSLEYKWFTPSAFGLIFFSVIWFAFLAFWYGMAFGTGAPWIFFVFPLIHVSVGIWLVYYSISLILNKTKIIVSDNQLNVIHYPIPWYKGNKKFNTDEFDQLYVKEKINRGKNSTQKSYSIRAKLKKGKDIEIASIGGLESQDALRIEEYLEQYLGIDNMQVKGEFGSIRNASGSPHPRRVRRSSLTGIIGSIYSFEVGEEINYKSIRQKASHLTQYDWDNGNSDKLFQFLDKDNNDRLFYLKKDRALIECFEEDMLDLQESRNIPFNNSFAPDTITFKGQKFFLSENTSGKAFLTGITLPVDVKQWIYFTEDKSTYLRLVLNNEMKSFYIGQKAEMEHFETSLEEPQEDQLELRDLDYDLDEEKLSNWKDEDFV